MSLETEYKNKRAMRMKNREQVTKIMDAIFMAMNSMPDIQQRSVLTAVITEIQMALSGADKS